MISYVHQIGRQLRLGEHIAAKQQRDLARGVPAASETEVARRREWLAKASIDGDLINKVIERMRRGKPATQLNNDAYRLRLPEAGSNPFANIGKLGYEAQTREMLWLAESLGLPTGDTPGAEDEQS